jgi:hypothetical protein
VFVFLITLAYIQSTIQEMTSSHLHSTKQRPQKCGWLSARRLFGQNWIARVSRIRCRALASKRGKRKYATVSTPSVCILHNSAFSRRYRCSTRWDNSIFWCRARIETRKRTDESFKTIHGRAFKTIRGACARAAAPNLESINGDKVNNTGLNVHIKRNRKVRAVCLFLKLPTETTCMTLPTSGPLCNAALLLKFIIHRKRALRSRHARMQQHHFFSSQPGCRRGKHECRVN